MVGITDGILTGKITLFITEKLQILMNCLLLIKPGFIFKMLPTKQKLHIGYSWFAYTICTASQWFWLIQLLEAGRSRSAGNEMLSSFLVLFSSSEPACHYTTSRQYNQELKMILTCSSFHGVSPTYSLNINISILSKFKWLIQLRNSWSSIFWTQYCSVQISL